MGGLRRFGDTLRFAVRAQSEWELGMSRRILGSRRRLAVLLALTLPILLISAAGAADFLPDKIPILGGSKAFMPSFVTPTMFFGSIVVGLVAGLITGVIGAGGGYILTPALMSFGVRGIMAVGTDQFHLFAKAIMGTTIHRKLGNVNFKLAAWFVVGSLTGVTFGGKINRAIFQYSPALSDALISSVYVVVLGLLGAYSVMDWLRLRKAGSASGGSATTALAQKLQAMPLKPRIAFDRDLFPGGRSISVYPVILCGLVVGFVAAIMGVGGGFLTFPMFVYGLGVSTFTTVGTDILQIIFTTAYSSIFQYAVYGFVFYTVSIGMLLGSLIGVQLGAMVTKIVPGAQIRVFYALTILAGFANRLCALPRKLGDLGYLSISRNVAGVIETVGTVAFFGIVGVFAIWILTVFFRNLGNVRQGDGRGLIANPGKFRTGLIGLVTFFIVLGIGFCPIVRGENALQWADRLFNQLAKDSANYIAEGRAKGEKYAAESIDFGVAPREFAEEEKLVRVVESAGLASLVEADGRIRIKGRLGDLSNAALNDAESAFRNEWEELGARVRDERRGGHSFLVGGLQRPDAAVRARESRRRGEFHEVRGAEGAGAGVQFPRHSAETDPAKHRACGGPAGVLYSIHALVRVFDHVPLRGNGRQRLGWEEEGGVTPNPGFEVSELGSRVQNGPDST
jgi:hypothetical protein